MTKKKKNGFVIPPNRAEEDKACEEKQAIRDRLRKETEQWLSKGNKIGGK